MPYFVRRGLVALLVLTLAACLNFVAVRAAPGNYADFYASTHLILGGGESVSTVDRTQIEHEFGLDQPVPIQFVDYLGQLLRLNLGSSFEDGQPVSVRLWSAAQNTLPLVGVGVLLGILLGVFLAVLAILFHGRRLEGMIASVATFAYSLPAHWLGILLLMAFAGLLPIGGREDPFVVYPSWLAEELDVVRHMILPGATLALLTFGGYTLIVRSAMLDVLAEPHVQFARARGFSRRWIVIHEVLRNALLPTVNVGALSLGHVFGGAILIEVVFSWPGLGLLARQAIAERDYPVIEGTFLLVTLAVVILNFVADVMAGFLDPRVRIHR